MWKEEYDFLLTAQVETTTPLFSGSGETGNRNYENTSRAMASQTSKNGASQQRPFHHHQQHSSNSKQ
jgi:hypothetical protein